jgi:hypothetical protein
LRAAQSEKSEIISDGVKSLTGERDSAWQMVCRIRLLRAGPARPLRSEPSNADPLVRRRCRLLVHLYSNRPDACAQRCLHRSSKGYTLATYPDRARTGEFWLARPMPRPHVRSRELMFATLTPAHDAHRRSERTEPSWLQSTPAAAAALVAASRRAQRWPATVCGDDVCRVRARPRAGAGS